MKLFINTRSGVPIYRQLVHQLEKGVAGGILKAGDQLPTVREIALELTINPNTVARAYRELEHLGLIKSIQGRGSYIAENVKLPQTGEKELLLKQMVDELFDEARQLNVEPDIIIKLIDEVMKQREKEV